MDIPNVLLWVIAVGAIVIAAILTIAATACLRVTRFALAEALIVADAGIRDLDKIRSRRIRSAQRLVQDPARTAGALATFRSILFLIAGSALTLAVWRYWRASWPVLLAVLLVATISALITAAVSVSLSRGRRTLHTVIALSPLISGIVALTGWASTPNAAEFVGPTDEELRDMVERVGESNAIEKDERELISAVFELRDTIVREVMVPRTEMVTVNGDLPLKKVLRLMLRSGYSRVPVTGDTMDDLVGIAYLEDVAQLIDADPLAADRPIRLSARSATFVPESKPADELLREMQAATSHIAMVFDEYGGIAGLVTVEDVLEELVGELVDEHDSRHLLPEIEEAAPGIWRVPARTPVDELGDLFDIRLEDDDIDTVGGLLAKALGKVPIVGAEAEVSGLRLTADRIGGRRKQLATVLVTRIAPNEVPNGARVGAHDRTKNGHDG
ncbi:MAG: hemolysin family protein [Cellulomonadaceae bacterium]|jgi:CBS domain containing-hemolysin-like protein|nr:hemolysin family protein [Cellulomonadaceae bacterium]